MHSPRIGDRAVGDDDGVTNVLAIQFSITLTFTPISLRLSELWEIPLLFAGDKINHQLISRFPQKDPPMSCFAARAQRQGNKNMLSTDLQSLIIRLKQTFGNTKQLLEGRVPPCLKVTFNYHPSSKVRKIRQ